MTRCGLFVLKAPLNTNQPHKIAEILMQVVWFHWSDTECSSCTWYLAWKKLK